MLKLVFALLLALILFADSPVDAQQPKPIAPAEIAGKLSAAREAAVLGLLPEYVVEGTKIFDGWIIPVEKLIFKPGSKLVFSKKALEIRNEFFIVAREISSTDPNQPGTIAWQDEGGPSDPAPLAGQAPSGSAGGEDQNGAPGANGATGNNGLAGRIAPGLTIFVSSIQGSGPIVDFRGQNGGKGGAGQKGGDGGKGGHGHSASQTAVDCRRGPGNGGNGGDGGTGGAGGTGGKGGNGGTVTLVSLAENLAMASRAFRVDVGGGTGGSDGEGGPGGNAGAGGPVGAEQLPFCRRGGRHDGATGRPGTPGPKGSTGPNGNIGDFLVTGLSKDQFDRLFGATR